MDKFGDKKHAESGAYDFVLSVWDWMIRAGLRSKVDGETRTRTAALMGHSFFEAMVDQISLAAWVEMAESVPAHFSKIRTASLEKRQGLWSARYLMDTARAGRVAA